MEVAETPADLDVDRDHDTEPPARSVRAERARIRTRVRQRRYALAACVVVVLGVYLHCASSYQKSLDPAPDRRDFQNLIADAFLHGQTNLTIPTPKLLLKLKNPYDPKFNQPAQDQGLHDLSYYKGKLYVYFGPAPAVLLFIPYRLLHVGDLSPTLAGLIFCIAGFAFSVLLFQFLVKRLFGSIPIWVEAAAVLALGLAIPAPFIIYVGRAYEVSIACGYAEVFIGLYFLARGLWAGPEPKLVPIAIGSLFLGGAVAARPAYLVAGLFVVTAAVLLWRHDRRQRFEHPVRLAIALLGPYLVIGFLLALYNYVRFGSVSEFGTSYQLLGVDPQTYPFNQLWYIPHGIYYFLFSPARYLDTFPFIFLRLNTFDSATYLQAYQNEPVAGILTNMPIITIGLLMALGTRAVSCANGIRPVS